MKWETRWKVEKRKENLPLSLLCSLFPEHCFTLYRSPPNIESVLEQWAHLRHQYPNAQIISSSLDDFVKEVKKSKLYQNLPIFTGILLFFLGLFFLFFFFLSFWSISPFLCNDRENQNLIGTKKIFFCFDISTFSFSIVLVSFLSSLFSLLFLFSCFVLLLVFLLIPE